MEKELTPSVVPNPSAGASLKRGFDALARVMALTLGPTQGMILSESTKDRRPESLSDAAIIARRIIALPDRAEDVGAMLLRNLVWRMHLKVGDGSAMAAVLAQAILDRAYQEIASGVNAMSLRRGVERATRAATVALRQMSRPAHGEQDLVNVAQTVTAEPDLSLILGEMFDLLGPDAHITVEDYAAPLLDREYQEGGRWRGHLASSYLVTDLATQRALLPDCRVALFAGDVTNLEDVRPLLELAAGREPHHVALIAREIKGVALGTLVVNHQQGDLRILAVEMRQPESDFEDLAVLTGAQLLAPERGRSLRSITADDLGMARCVEADADELVVVGNMHHSTLARQQITALRAQMDQLAADDKKRNGLHLRIARLSGSAATLKIGSLVNSGREMLKAKAEKGLRVLPIALREGVVPGGGVAYLNCIPAVRQVQAEGEEAWGVAILAHALQEPFRCIVQNAGVAYPDLMMARVQQRGNGQGYDAVTGQIVSMDQAGIVDAAGVLRRALETAVSGAVMALTTETIVFKRRPEISYEP